MPFGFNFMYLVNLRACFVNFVVNYWPRICGWNHSTIGKNLS